MPATKPRAYQVYDIDWKQAVRALADTNINLASPGALVIDAVVLQPYDRVLLTAQTDATENGIYQVNAAQTLLEPAPDWINIDSGLSSAVNAGLTVAITQGAQYAQTTWTLTTPNPIILGTTTIVFEQVPEASDRIGNIYFDGSVIELANSVPETSISILPSGAGTDVGIIIPDEATANVDDLHIFNNVVNGNVKISTIGGDWLFDHQGHISGTGNVQAGYFIGNGSMLTGLIVPDNYSNANVANYLPTYTGNITANFISITGNISANNAITSTGVYTTELQAQTIGAEDLYVNSNIFADGLLVNTETGITANGGNITVNQISGNGGYVNALGAVISGNVDAAYFIGNGSQLTGLSSPYGNANVANYLPGYTGNLGVGNVNFVNGSTVKTAVNNINMNANTGGAVEITTDGGNYTWSYDNYGWMMLPQAQAAYTPVVNGSVLFGSEALVFKAGYANLIFDNAGNLDIDGNLSLDRNIETNTASIISSPGFLGIYANKNDINDGIHIYPSLTEVFNSSLVNIVTGLPGDSHIWTFDPSANLSLPNNGSIIGVTGNNSGYLQWIGNSSGDGLGYTTLTLVPDDTVISQALILDPTAPGHIHLRAPGIGGNVEQPAANILLGAEQTNFEITAQYGVAPEARIHSGGETWTFDNNGDLYVPNYIRFTGNTFIGDEPGAGTPYFRIDTPLGYPATITTDADISGNNWSWTFGADGNLTLPSNKNIIVDGGDGVIGPVSDDLVISWDNEELILRSVAGSVEVQADNSFQIDTNYNSSYKRWIFDANGYLVHTSGDTQVYSETGSLTLQGGAVGLGSGNVSIVSVETGVAVQNWIFDNTGNLTAPGNIITTGNFVGSGSNVELIAQSAEWTFDTTGNLTVAGSIIMPGGASLLGDGSSPAPSISGFASIGAVNLTASGNVNANIVNMSGGAKVTNNSSGGIQLIAAAGGTVRLSSDNDNNFWILGTDGRTLLPLVTVNGTSGAWLGSNGNLNIEALGKYWQFGSSGNLTLPGNTFAVNYANGTAVSLAGTYGNSNVAALMADFGSNSISTTGNVTANNISGNISITGNVQGTQPNVTLIAGSYSYVFDNTGIATFPAVGGDEGGEINFGIPASNTTLTGPVKFDVYQNQIRFFDGSTKGLYIDVPNCATGVSTAIGYRDIPQISLSANVTANGTVAGKHFYSTTAGNITLTIPDNANVAFPTGATLTVVVNAAGNVIVAQGTGVSLYLAGSSTTGNRTVGAYGLASVMKVATDTWVISGTGVY